MAELKIFKPEVKKPDGATEKIALSGTILPFEHRKDFPVNGVSDVLYFSQYEGLLYQWDTNNSDYKPLNADSIYYHNSVGNNTEGKISIKLTSDEFGMPVLSPVFSKYNEGAGSWIDKKILLEGDVSIDLSDYATQEWVGNNFLSLNGGTINGNLVVTNTTDTKILTVDIIEPWKSNASVRVGGNLVIKNGSVVLGDNGQVHARGQFTTHANRILFSSQYNDNLPKEEQFSYSLGLPFAADEHTKNVAAFLPEDGGHLATKEYLKNEFCYWSVKKFWYDYDENWYVHLTVEGKNIDHITLLLCSQSEGWSSPKDTDFTIEYDDNFVTHIYFNGTEFSRLIRENIIGAYNFKITSHLGHVRDMRDFGDCRILRHPVYFKFVAVTKNNYKFDSAVMRVTQRPDGRYILDIQ